jgi:hypothetical protein
MPSDLKIILHEHAPHVSRRADKTNELKAILYSVCYLANEELWSDL